MRFTVSKDLYPLMGKSLVNPLAPIFCRGRGKKAGGEVGKGSLFSPTWGRSANNWILMPQNRGKLRIFWIFFSSKWVIYFRTYKFDEGFRLILGKYVQEISSMFSTPVTTIKPVETQSRVEVIFTFTIV